jgi:hypothetical protein
MASENSYQVVPSLVLGDLVRAVSAMIRDGWVPAGGITYVQIEGKGEGQYLQAVYRPPTPSMMGVIMDPNR